MQLTIEVPDNFTKEQVAQIIHKLKDLFHDEGLSIDVKEVPGIDADPWDNLDIEEIAVDTGIEDFAENHDHYLYGISKKS
ncbi:MAG: hypothetical protein ACQERN_13265 [Thermodesulfobacteriota bacterium]